MNVAKVLKTCLSSIKTKATIKTKLITVTSREKETEKRWSGNIQIW